MKKIYLDNAATTKPDPEVTDAMLPYFKNDFGNASSIHGFGKSAKVLLEDTRDILAEFLGVSSKEIVFTGSGTEADNHALKGFAFRHFGSGKDHIISSSVEHSAVIDTLNYLEKRFHFKITYLKPDRYGRISADQLLSNLTPSVFLVSLMHSNNETGVINDIKGISGSLQGKDIAVHTDMVQSLGKIKFDLKDLGADLASFSAHKIYGPKGIGALYIKNGTALDKFIHGGKQERDIRGGTESIPLIAGFKKAVELLKRKSDEDIATYNSLKDRLNSGLKKNFGDGVIFNSDNENCLPNIVNISFDKNKFTFDEEMLLIQLDLKGIAVSGGSACTAGTLKPSYVLKEIGLDERTAMGSLRISFGRTNTADEIDFLMDALKDILKQK
ncbi:MAG: cysteine desulfurase [Bacteroidetes bacterium]|nr:cysteine desulfurase [Bacteroidota bacterium]